MLSPSIFYGLTLGMGFLLSKGHRMDILLEFCAIFFAPLSWSPGKIESENVRQQFLRALNTRIVIIGLFSF